jgi:hypothetical protein
VPWLRGPMGRVRCIPISIPRNWATRGFGLFCTQNGARCAMEWHILAVVE